MLVLGIDPGTATTGFGVVVKENSLIKPVDFGVIKTSPKTDLAFRLLDIHRAVLQIIEKHRPQALAIEELFFARNTKSAFAVCQARGGVILTAAQCGLPVFEYTPLQVKQAVVGYGQAEKNQVQQMVKRLLKMDTIVKPDDAADALAIAICHINSYRLGREQA
ncbi:MAG: crossover junction endodeoxyribonuclease RuvC [Candidatus Saccharibacteria bacterium]